MSLAPQTACVDRGGEWTSIPVSELKIGDTVLVKAGESVAVDVADICIFVPNG